MDLRKALLAEHSKAQTTRIVKWIGNDKKRFAGLVKIFLNSEYRVTQRAAWPIGDCVKAHPELALPHLGKLIDHLSRPGLHPAVPRNTLRLLEEIDIPEKYLGRLVDVCFRFLQSSDSSIAIKAYAITLASRIADREPDLRRELKLVVEPLLEEESSAIRVRAKRVLATL